MSLRFFRQIPWDLTCECGETLIVTLNGVVHAMCINPKCELHGKNFEVSCPTLPAKEVEG